jgi:hypothetical protein
VASQTVGDYVSSFVWSFQSVRSLFRTILSNILYSVGCGAGLSMPERAGGGWFTEYFTRGP